MSKAVARLETALVTALQKNLASGKPVTVPEAGRLLWRLFSELAETRTWHMNGPNAISYEEIKSFCALQRWSLKPHHVEILRAMDNVYLEHFYSKQKNKADGVKTIGKASGDISPALFDAVFG